jgi:hypothetical protein
VTAARRVRVAGAVAAVTCLAAGLATQLTGFSPVIDALASVLYVVLVGALVMVAGPRLPGLAVAAIAFGFATVIELLQLAGISRAIVEVIPAAHLVFGNAFDPVDLAAYAGGAIVVFVLRRLAARRAPEASARPVD